MEAKIQYFQSPVFGQIRVTVIDDKPMFVANDVAAMLGYAKPANAITGHCKGAIVLMTPTKGGMQNVKFIPESDCLPLNYAFENPRSRKVPRLDM